jgi:hypothetical protein
LEKEGRDSEKGIVSVKTVNNGIGVSINGRNKGEKEEERKHERKVRN